MKQATYNPLTHTYDTPDGTAVAAELVDSAETASDVFRIATIREQQRATPHPKEGGKE